MSTSALKRRENRSQTTSMTEGGPHLSSCYCRPLIFCQAQHSGELIERRTPPRYYYLYCSPQPLSLQCCRHLQGKSEDICRLSKRERNTETMAGLLPTVNGLQHPPRQRSDSPGPWTAAASKQCDWQTSVACVQCSNRVETYPVTMNNTSLATIQLFPVSHSI